LKGHVEGAKQDDWLNEKDGTALFGDALIIINMTVPTQKNFIKQALGFRSIYNITAQGWLKAVPSGPCGVILLACQKNSSKSRRQ